MAAFAQMPVSQTNRVWGDDPTAGFNEDLRDRTIRCDMNCR